MTLFLDSSLLEILSWNVMTYSKLKQLAKGITRHITHKKFQWIRALSLIQLPFDNGVVTDF